MKKRFLPILVILWTTSTLFAIDQFCVTQALVPPSQSSSQGATSHFQSFTDWVLTNGGRAYRLQIRTSSRHLEVPSDRIVTIIVPTVTRQAFNRYRYFMNTSVGFGMIEGQSPFSSTRNHAYARVGDEMFHRVLGGDIRHNDLGVLGDEVLFRQHQGSANNSFVVEFNFEVPSRELFPFFRDALEGTTRIGGTIVRPVYNDRGVGLEDGVYYENCVTFGFRWVQPYYFNDYPQLQRFVSEANLAIPDARHLHGHHIWAPYLHHVLMNSRLQNIVIWDHERSLSPHWRFFNLIRAVRDLNLNPQTVTELPLQ